MRVSVVIPVKDEERTIGRLLDSLANQTRKPDEIVVVDGGSSDRTVEIVRTYISRGHPVRLICTDHAYPGQARNIGAALARGEVLVFWDGGMIAQEDTLERLVRPIMAGEADLVHGRLVIDPVGFMDRCYMVALLPAWNAQKDGLRFNAHPVANTAMRKNVWEAVGGFPPWRAGEDQAFRESVGASGARIAYVPEAVAIFQPGETFARLICKTFVYSRHNLIAGRGRRWHLGLARIYGTTLLASVLFALAGKSFLVGFVVFTWLQLSLRTLKSVWQKKGFLPFSPCSIPTILGAFLLLLGADFATVGGAFAWLLGDRLRLAPVRFRAPRVLCVVPEERT